MKEIFDAMTYLYNGIWIRSDNGHPCGWDFVDLSDSIEVYKGNPKLHLIINHKIEDDMINEGYIIDNPYDNMTLKEFFSIIKGFWLGGIPEESYVEDDKYCYKWNGEIE